MSGTRGGSAASSRWGSRWRWRCCCWRQRGDGRQVLGRPVRLARRRRRRLGPTRTGGAKFRPDALVRHPGRPGPLRRRPPEELHPRWPGRRSPAPATPAGAGTLRPGTGITRVQRHLVARAARRDRAADRRRQLERRLRRLRRGRGTDTTPREFVAGFYPAQPALEDRLLCARAESKWCSIDPGSWSAIRALTITVEDDSRPRRRRSAARCTAGGWRRGAQARQLLGQRRRRRRPLRRNGASTAPA